jgi:hypothetical protein
MAAMSVATQITQFGTARAVTVDQLADPKAARR